MHGNNKNQTDFWLQKSDGGGKKCKKKNPLYENTHKEIFFLNTGMWFKKMFAMRLWCQNAGEYY